MTGGKSGEAMSDILWESLGPDYKKTKEDTKDGIITTTVEERVGLDCAQKLFAVCGDNATNNDTFCDHFHSRLLSLYENDPAPDSEVPRCRFRGRASRIRCIAHIISLVVAKVLAKLKSGDYAQTAALVEGANANGGTFTEDDCLILSIYQKVRAFVLWIQGSDDRRVS
jgi:hypothetical protein